MKIDKETLIKHRFWVGLGVAVPLTLLALFVLLTFVNASVTRQRAKVQKQVAEIKNLSGAKNELNVKAKEAQAKEVEGQKNEVWGKAYKAQAKLFPWPSTFEKEFPFENGPFVLEVKVLAPGTLKANEPKDEKHFAGKIVGRNVFRDYLDVLAEGETKPKRFFRAGNSRVVDARGGAAPTGKDGKKEKDKKDQDKKDKDKQDRRDSFDLLEIGDEVVIVFQRGRYFDEPLTKTEMEKYPAAYRLQVLETLKLIEPVDGAGEGVVRLGTWKMPPDTRPLQDLRDDDVRKLLPPASSSFFHHVTWRRLDLDYSKEAWLAQEELWIQHEVFRLIREVNDSVSKFDYLLECQGAGGEGKVTFQNANWKLEMELLHKDRPELKVVMTSASAQEPTLDQKFLIKFTKDGPPEEIIISAADFAPKPEPPVELKGEPKKLPKKDGKGEVKKSGADKKPADKKAKPDPEPPAPEPKKAEPKKSEPIVIGLTSLPGERKRTGIWDVRQVIPYRAVAMKEAAQGGPGRDKSYAFVNPYWRLDVALKGDDDAKLEVKVTNPLPKRQKLDLKFRLLFDARFKLTDSEFASLRDTGVPEAVLSKLSPLKEKDFERELFLRELADKGVPERLWGQISNHARFHPDAEEIFLGGIPLEPADGGKKDNRTIEVELKEARVRTGIYGVEQVLTPQTAAVRAIEEISFTAQSVRTATRPLRSLTKTEPKKDKEGKDQKPQEKEKEVPKKKFPPGKDKDKEKDKGFPKGGLKDVVELAVNGPNGVSYVRYGEATEQFRRIPLAVVIVVDQGHIERVMTAFRNSPMRFKMTQFTLHRHSAGMQANQPKMVPNPILPKGGPPKNPFEMKGPGKFPGFPGKGGFPGGGGVPGGGFPGGGFPGGGVPGGGFPGPGPGPVGPKLPPQQPPTPRGMVDDTEVNLELVIYGEITLYNRFPPAPPAPATKN